MTAPAFDCRPMAALMLAAARGELGQLDRTVLGRHVVGCRSCLFRFNQLSQALALVETAARQERTARRAAEAGEGADVMQFPGVEHD